MGDRASCTYTVGPDNFGPDDLALNGWTWKRFLKKLDVDGDVWTCPHDAVDLYNGEPRCVFHLPPDESDSIDEARELKKTIDTNATESAKHARRHTQFLNAKFGQIELFEETLDTNHRLAFHGATFHKKANFADTTFVKGADFTAATFKEKPYFTSTNFGEATFDVITVPKINFERTTFEEGVNFTEAVFKDGVSFRNTKFKGKRVAFDYTTFEKSADFADSIFNEKASFFLATFMEEPNFGGVTFHEIPIFELSEDSAKPNRRPPRDTEGLPQWVKVLAAITGISGFSAYTIWEIATSQDDEIQGTVDELEERNKELKEEIEGLKEEIEELEGKIEGDIRESLNESATEAMKDTIEEAVEDATEEAVMNAVEEFKEAVEVTAEEAIQGTNDID